MLKDFFDDQTEPIVRIEEFYGGQKHIVEKCLITVRFFWTKTI